MVNRYLIWGESVHPVPKKCPRNGPRDDLRGVLEDLLLRDVLDDLLLLGDLILANKGRHMNGAAAGATHSEGGD